MKKMSVAEIRAQLEALGAVPGGAAVCWQGLWVRWEDALILHEVLVEQQYSTLTIHPGDTVLDIGAHIGAFTCDALRRGAGHVIAVEPYPSSAALLRRNTAPFGARVTVVETAVVGTEVAGGLLDLVVMGRAHNARLARTVTRPTAARYHHFPVKTITLQALITAHRPGVIKIDAEGAEYDFLVPLPPLAGVREIIIELHRRTAAECEAALRLRSAFLPNDWHLVRYRGRRPEQSAGNGPLGGTGSAYAMNATPLWAWMNERHHMYLRRQLGQPWPWTADPIFRAYRFTNVYRELDRTTIWIRQHIREPHADNPHLWWIICAARIYNQPGMLADFGDVWPRPERDSYEASEFLALVQARRVAGKLRYGAAYMLTAAGSDKAPVGVRPAWASSKDFLYTHKVLLGLWERRDEALGVLADGSTEIFCRWLRTQYGFGGFLAYEVACDLHYTKWLRGAPDRDTWAHAGPGAVRGLNRLLGRGLRAPMPEVEALGRMRELLAEANTTDVLGAHLSRPLHLREIEHSLCETDKYLRAQTGEGAPKQLYRPERSPRHGH